MFSFPPLPLLPNYPPLADHRRGPGDLLGGRRGFYAWWDHVPLVLTVIHKKNPKILEVILRVFGGNGNVWLWVTGTGGEGRRRGRGARG